VESTAPSADVAPAADPSPPASPPDAPAAPAAPDPAPAPEVGDGTQTPEPVSPPADAPPPVPDTPADPMSPADPAPADEVPVDAPDAGLVVERVTTVVVTQYTRRNDHDVLPGQFARIDAGEHAGEIGVFESVVSTGDDGYPDEVNVTLRNTGELIVCAYADLSPTPFGGR
jgi:hypothetical protein